MNPSLTLLSEGKIWGNDIEPQLEVLNKYGVVAALTDVAILTGAYTSSNTVDEDNSLAGRTGWFWTASSDNDGDVRVVNINGNKRSLYRYRRRGAIRPALQSDLIFSNISPNIVRGYKGTEEVEYGEFPQMALDLKMQNAFESNYTKGLLSRTGRSYTFDSRKYDDYDNGFLPVVYDEYEFGTKKTIRMQANSSSGEKFKLSNGQEYKNGDFVWVEVSPVKWLVDRKTGILVAKKGLLSGIRYHKKEKEYNGDFNTTEMKVYLDSHMTHDLFQTTKLDNLSKEEKEQLEKERAIKEKKRNPYNFNFNSVSEEEIIKGAIESSVAVFLHGPSSEGKSARVKQIDPTCEIIYLRNATPESLNGKSVYNQATGEMMDVPPTWLKKLQEKCEKEPERLHIVFLDEITNALPSIQGIAFNIVLDREVNGIWKLPDNARIVAAGNEMKDSLAANQLAEPLFNRFAHVYIKTTTEAWLKWASENNIHPAIYSYIAFTNGKALRSEYDGEKPNADPRKWEMASKMLYKTRNPEMIRSLVGEDITREFVSFCNQPVIILDDVLNGNYTKEEIECLNTGERYATIMGLSQVDEDNFEKVRNFALELGPELRAVFDSLWSHGDETRLEKIAELNIFEKQERGIENGR